MLKVEGDRLKKVKKRVVVKIGTAVLTRSRDEFEERASRVGSWKKLSLGMYGNLNLAVIKSIVASTVKLLDDGAEVIIVSSGAIGAGLSRIKLHGYSLQHKQALASIGQAQLINIYDRFFHRHGRIVAQVLLTKDDLENKKRMANARNTFENLLGLGVVPIVNENDTVAIDEIKFGDNDMLSAEVAVKIKADMIVILTDVDGLFSNDPRNSGKAELIKEVRSITPEIFRSAGGSVSGCGTGGMASKLRAVKLAASRGITSYIANGRKKDVLWDIWKGNNRGTLFFAGRKRVRP